MLKFDLDKGECVYLDPLAVEMVREVTVQGRAGARQLAGITLLSGARVLVCDPDRDVGERIMAAKDRAVNPVSVGCG